MSDILEHAANPETPERRVHARLPVLSASIQLDDDNGGIILNICERGLAMQAVRSLADDRFPQMRFQLSPSAAWIETQGRIAWISASKTTAGIELVNLSDQARILLTQWISSAVHPNATEKLNTLAENVAPVKLAPAASEEPDSRLKLFPQETRSDHGTINHEQAHGSPTARQILLFLIAVLIVSVSGFLGYHLRKPTDGKQGLQFPASTAPAEIAPSGSSSPVTPSLDTKLSLDTPGFILQVGAMKHEENADALAELLRRKDFPAFVFLRKTDSFYRVAVGPYSDAETARKCSEALKRQGFQSIRKEWNPLAQ